MLCREISNRPELSRQLGFPIQGETPERDKRNKEEIVESYFGFIDMKLLISPRGTKALESGHIGNRPSTN